MNKKMKKFDALEMKQKLSEQFTKTYFREDGSFNYEKWKKREEELGFRRSKS